jgi:hypothetical protein
MHSKCGALPVFLLAPPQNFLYLKPFRDVEFKLAMMNIHIPQQKKIKSVLK